MEKKLKIQDFEIIRTPNYITWENLEKVMGKRMFKKFNNWMRGQTCLQDGAYPEDVERFINNRPVID